MVVNLAFVVKGLAPSPQEYLALEAKSGHKKGALKGAFFVLAESQRPNNRASPTLNGVCCGRVKRSSRRRLFARE